jgi:hypothetical protein
MFSFFITLQFVFFDYVGCLPASTFPLKSTCASFIHFQKDSTSYPLGDIPHSLTMVPSIWAHRHDHQCSHNIVCCSPRPGRLIITIATNDKINKHLSHKDTKEDGHRDCHQNESKLWHQSEHFQNKMTSKHAGLHESHSVRNWLCCMSSSAHLVPIACSW